MSAKLSPVIHLKVEVDERTCSFNFKVIPINVSGKNCGMCHYYSKYLTLFNLQNNRWYVGKQSKIYEKQTYINTVMI